MEIGDSSTTGLNPEAGAAGGLAEQLRPQAEVVEQKSGQVVIKESFCVPWVEAPAADFDPAQVGWEQAAGKVLAKIQEMLAAPEVILTPDGLTPTQATAKEQAELAAAADARAAKLAEDLAAARMNVEQAAAEATPAPVLAESPVLAATEINQLVEAASSPTPALAAETPALMESEPKLSASSMPEAGGGGLDQLLEQVPAEQREEIEKRLVEFGEDFDEDKFSKEHPEEHEFISQVISEASDPAKAAEAAGKVKARLDSLDKQEDGDKKKKDFLVNLFGIYQRRLNQEKNPEKREELKKSMLGLNKELAGLGVGSLGGILEVIIGAIVGEVQEQLK